MVLEVGSLSHSSLIPFGTWLDTHIPVDGDIIPCFHADPLPALLLQADHGASPRSILSSTRCAKPGSSSAVCSPIVRGGVAGDPEARGRELSSNVVETPSGTPTKSQARHSSAAPGFRLSPTPTLDSYNFPSHDGFSTSAKRPRATSDVDGPYTAELSCKKRRLRLRLITSRLSQPFSIPATHIINRDGLASGDRRFKKLATSLDSTKRTASQQSSVLRRAAVLNSLRLRVRYNAVERGDMALATAAANAAVQHHGLQLVTGARFLSSATLGAADGSSTATMPLPRSPLLVVSASDTLEQKVWSSARPSNLRASDTVTLRLPKSPRAKPTLSPNLLPVDSLLDDIDDESVAFPTSEHESRYDLADDPEHVYSDFGAIFGDPAEADQLDEEEEEEDHSYEEYLDELDGISWIAR